nr:Rop guanine nucleotide exchange factor 1-like [Tanacetum cinerariifolium]
MLLDTCGNQPLKYKWVDLGCYLSHIDHSGHPHMAFAEAPNAALPPDCRPTLMVHEVDMMKEWFAKLLLREDMSGGGKGGCCYHMVMKPATNILLWCSIIIDSFLILNPVGRQGLLATLNPFEIDYNCVLVFYSLRVWRSSNDPPQWYSSLPLFSDFAFDSQEE